MNFFIKNINTFFIPRRKIDIQTLPSMGMFYNDDMNIYIRKASKKVIEQYNISYSDRNPIDVLSSIKKVLESCAILNKNYTFSDIKGVDVMFLFIEIVKYTKDKDIYIDNNGVDIEFSSNTFLYNKNSSFIKDYYDPIKKCINYDGYSATLPSIGIEQSIINYISENYIIHDEDKWFNYSYDFMYFLSDKSEITNADFLNLICLFNDDMSEDERKSVRKIVNNLLSYANYSLIDGYNNIIDLKSKINFKEIWKTV